MVLFVRIQFVLSEDLFLSKAHLLPSSFKSLLRLWNSYLSIFDGRNYNATRLTDIFKRSALAFKEALNFGITLYTFFSRHIDDCWIF